MFVATLRKVIWITRTQIMLALLLSAILILAHFNVILPPDELGHHLYSYFERFGAPFVAVVSFLENIVGLNAYFPGSIVILTAMAMTAGNPFYALVIFLCITIPAMLSNMVNYLIGRTFRARKLKTDTLNDNKELSKQGWSMWIWFFSTFWHPHLAALTSIACGTEKLPFRNFLKYLLVSSLLWNTFWGLAMYNFGQFIKVDGNLIILFAIYLIVWILWDIYREFYKKSSLKPSEVV